MPREQYEIRWKDYYQILQVDPTAGYDKVVAAYRRLAMAYHPDRNHSSDATEKFQEINEAREVLTDFSRRSFYDEVYWARQRGEHYEEPTEETWNTYDYQDSQWEEETQSQSSGSRHSWSSQQQDQGSHQDSRGSGYRWNGYRSNSGWGHQRSWDSGTGWEERTTREPEPDEPTVRETREKVYSSRFFLLVQLSYLVDRFSPDPDESQRILPWPSWAWQRAILVAGMPLALMVFLLSAAQGSWVLLIAAALWFAAALYSGILTRWMRGTGQAPAWARVTGGTCIVLNGVSYLLALAYAVLIAVIAVAAFLMTVVILRAMIDRTMGQR